MTTMVLALLILLFSCGVCGNCQLVFPDDFEPTGQFPQNERQRPPFPTFPPNAFVPSQPNNPPALSSQQEKSAGVAIPSVPLAESNIATNPLYGLSPEEIYWSNHVNNIIAHGVMKFTLDMDRAIDANQRELAAGQDLDNIVFSPISIVGTLAMVLLGSAGKTFEEVVRILGFESGVDISNHSEIVHQMIGLLLDSIDPKLQLGNTSGPEISFADGIFVQTGYPIRPEFLSISQAVYNNEVINVDFARQSESAQHLINNWVNMRTHGKIRNILSEPPISATRVIFASALYFNAEWNQHFIDSGTKKKPFLLPSNRTVTVDMMFNSGFFPFYEDHQLGVKIVGLPYRNREINGVPLNTETFESLMYILLPTSTDPNALITLESKLTPTVIETLISRMENKSCIIGLPKMKLSSTLNLNRALQSLGLVSLFSPEEANLALLSSGINTSTLEKPRIVNPRANNGGLVQHSAANHTGHSNYFRYEDKKGGYKVEQWNSGVHVEKIHRVYRRKRSSRRTSAVSGGRVDQPGRHRRQTRPVDADFVRFIESQGFPKYGLDDLRHNASLVNPRLYASDVLHKVEIDITETGTVGAAATGIIIQRDGNSKILVANRPFTFFIRHESSRLILFWGSINKPTPNYP